MLFAFLSNVISAEAGATILLPLTIIVCAMFLEDLTIVVVGLLAADNFVSVPIALVSLYIGVSLGDVMFYAIGTLVRTHPKLALYVEHDFTAPVRSWLDRRYRLTIFSGHFVPGLRSTTYIASGFFRYPLTKYLPSALSGGLVLLLVLFTVAYWFGNVTRFIGPARWVVAALFVAVLVIMGRRNLESFQAERARLAAEGKEE